MALTTPHGNNEGAYLITNTDGTKFWATPVVSIDDAGNRVAASGGSSALPAGTNRSGTAGTTASVMAPANAARVFLVGQNIGANNIWFNEIGGTAAANTAGSYRIVPGQGFSVSTSQAISMIAETGNTAFTATEG